MKETVSVVVPMYNVEERIAESLGSILHQDYPNIELVLVDDASTDATLERARNVLENAAVQSKTIVFEANKGVSAARNAGLLAASGEYVLFMDADDLADDTFVSELYNTIRRDKSDLAFCGFRSRYLATGEETVRPVRLDASRKYSPEALLIKRLRNEIKPGIFTLIFRRAFLLQNALRFFEGCSAGEDFEFVVKAFCRAKACSFSRETPYIYVIHEKMGSNLREREKKVIRYEHHTEAFFRIVEYVERYASSETVLSFVGNVLCPQAYIRLLTVHAMKHDRRKFMELSRSPSTRAILWRGVRAARFNAELCFKALWLLAAPGLYYRLRAKKY